MVYIQQLHKYTSPQSLPKQTAVHYIYNINIPICCELVCSGNMPALQKAESPGYDSQRNHISLGGPVR